MDETLDALREEDVRPVTFNFDAEAHPTKVFPEGPQIGFIAQELERVLPNLVHTGADGFKSVAYDRVSVYALAGGEGARGGREGALGDGERATRGDRRAEAGARREAMRTLAGCAYLCMC